MDKKKIILVAAAGVFVLGSALTVAAFVGHKSVPAALQNNPALVLQQIETKNLPVINQKTVSPQVPAASLSTETPLFKTIFSRESDKYSAVYEVKKGDSLTKISRQHGKTVELIKKINELSSDKITPGMKLKIPTCKFSVVVDKSQNTLLLKADEEILKTYVVSTGKDNSTPVGVFKVTDKIIDPTWYKANAVVAPGSADNELGTRWMGITAKGYGIHGTIHPDTIGQQVTAGCVRMKNEEVEELYKLIPPGTEVTIVD